VVSLLAGILALGPVLAQSSAARARGPDVIYVPTPLAVVERMLDLAKVGSKDIVYDLGCGDGRIVIEAAKRFGARGVGIDIDPQRIAESRTWCSSVLPICTKPICERRPSSLCTCCRAST
jgi:predicted RNA methylase